MGDESLGGSSRSSGPSSCSSSVSDGSFSCSSSNSSNSNNYDYGYDGGSSDYSTQSDIEMETKKRKSNPPNDILALEKVEKSQRKREKRSTKRESVHQQQEFSSGSNDDSDRPSTSVNKPSASESTEKGHNVKINENITTENSKRKVRFVSCSSNSSSRPASKPEALAAEALAAMGAMIPMGARASGLEMTGAIMSCISENGESKNGGNLSKIYRGGSMKMHSSLAASPQGESLARTLSSLTRNANNGNEENRRDLEMRPAPWYRYVDHTRPNHGIDRPPSPLVSPCFVPSFPVKLHCILLHEEYKECIKFLPHGRSWRITDSFMFEEKVLPVYFGPTKMSSFLRQLNAWGFKRMTKGRNKNSYYNELFLRGHPQFCKGMRPTRNQGTALSSSEEKKNLRACQIELEPDLFEIEKVSPLPEENSTDMKCLQAIHKLIVQEGPKAKMPLDIYIVGVEGHHVAKQMSAKMSANTTLECDGTPVAAAKAPPTKKARQAPSNEASSYDEQKDDIDGSQKNHDLDAGPPRKISFQDVSKRVASLETPSTKSSAVHNCVFPVFTSAAAQVGQNNNGPIPNQNLSPHFLDTLMKNAPDKLVSSPVDAAGIHSNSSRALLMGQGFPINSCSSGMLSNLPFGEAQQIRRQQHQPISSNGCFGIEASNIHLCAQSPQQNIAPSATPTSSSRQPNIDASVATAAQSFLSQASMHAPPFVAARSVQSNTNLSSAGFQSHFFPSPLNDNNPSRQQGCSLAVAEAIIQHNQQKANGIVDSLMHSFRQEEAAASAPALASGQNCIQNNRNIVLNALNAGQRSQPPQVQQAGIAPDVLEHMITWAVKEGAKFGAQHYISNRRNKKGP